MLLMEVSKCLNAVEFLKHLIKIKNFKTFYEPPAGSYSAHHEIKAPYGDIQEYTDTDRHLFS